MEKRDITKSQKIYMKDLMQDYLNQNILPVKNIQLQILLRGHG